MKTVASSGPPSPIGSSFREPPSPPADGRVRRRPVLVKNFVQWVSSAKMRLLRVQLWDAFYNFFDARPPPPHTLSTSGDLTEASTAPMFGTKRPTRVSRNRPLFSP